VESIRIEPGGTITVRMTAAEAADVRENLGGIWGSDISVASDKLHRLLEWATPAGRSAP
jgi:hypothetical protein